MSEIENIALATRSLKIGDKQVVIYLGHPESVDGDYICRYAIAFDDSFTRGKAFGVDAFQAILLALASIRCELMLLENKCGFNVIWLDNECGYRLFPEIMDS